MTDASGQRPGLLAEMTVSHHFSEWSHQRAR
jgi:hypothetical protein